jgi:hypothetical protein
MEMIRNNRIQRPHDEVGNTDVMFVEIKSTARLRSSDRQTGTELPVSMYTTKSPIDMCHFNVRSST